MLLEEVMMEIGDFPSFSWKGKRIQLWELLKGFLANRKSEKGGNTEV